MLVTLLKSKIHGARVTGKDINYEGSLTIDPELMEAAGFLPYERVEIYNITNGERFTTYLIPGKRGSREIVLNGASARKGEIGDILIVVAFTQVEEDKAPHFRPTIVILDEHNNPQRVYGT
jgi:aspartate 1-decarboxylase